MGQTGGQKQKSSDFLKKTYTYCQSVILYVLLNICSSSHQYIIKIKMKEFVFISLFLHTFTFIIMYLLCVFAFVFILLFLHIFICIIMYWLCVFAFICIYFYINAYKYINNQQSVSMQGSCAKNSQIAICTAVLPPHFAISTQYKCWQPF